MGIGVTRVAAFSDLERAGTRFTGLILGLPRRMRIVLSILRLTPRVLLRVLATSGSLPFVATGGDTRPGAAVTGAATEASVSSSGPGGEVNKASRKAPKALAGREDRYGALLPLQALTCAFK